MDGCTLNLVDTVLVVEDEPLIRKMAVSLAEDEGFAVLEASSAEAAVVILEDHPEIRIVFTDIHMKGLMDGLQLVAFAHHRWPPLRFLIVSGEHRPARDAIPEGARFFAKPYDGASIARALHSLL
jgi:CheY-like chemotaxis protein